MSKTSKVSDNESQLEKKVTPTPKTDKGLNGKNTQDIYFMILYPRLKREEPEDFIFSTPQNGLPIPNEILKKEIEGKDGG